MEEYLQINLNNLMQELGENKTKSILSNFECRKNSDVEDFIRNKAIEFDKRGFAKTYLIFFNDSNGGIRLVGYFSLANKPFYINSSGLTSNMKRKINTYGTYDVALKKYIVPAILIGQFAKNHHCRYNTLISGDELMKMAIQKVVDIQDQIGGHFVYVECEKEEKVIKFYESHGFVIFGERECGDRNESKTKKLIQLLKYTKQRKNL